MLLAVFTHCYLPFLREFGILLVLLLAAISEAEGGYSLSHYRDNRKREIDFIVERKDGALLGVEVKAGQASTGDFRHLKWFAENIAKTPFTGIVLYSGNKTLRFGDGLYAVPLAALGT